MKIKLLLILIIISKLCLGQGNGLYEFQNINGDYGFMDKNGKIIINPKYLTVKDFSEGLCFVSREVHNNAYLWICIDTLGNELFDIKNNFPETDFNSGFARITGTDGHIYIDKTGKNVFNKTFKDGRWDFRNGYALVSEIKHKGFRFIDLTGNYVAHLPFMDAFVFKNGLSECYTNEHGTTIFDTLGNVIIEDIQSADDLSEEFIKVKRNEKWGFIDRKGNIIIDFIYEKDRSRGLDEILKLNSDSLDALPKSRMRNVGNFSNGLAKIQIDGLWGYINTKNEVVIEPKYEKVSSFNEGFAGVSLDGVKWGFIDLKGNVVIEPIFFDVGRFERGICVVRTTFQLYRSGNGSYYNAIINTKGEIITRAEMHCCMGIQGELIKYYGGGDFSGGVYYLDLNGKIINPK